MGAITADSNGSGLRIAEETYGTPGTLPGTPVWEPYEPNSYGDFGGQTKTTARTPIAADRQRRKGVVTDFDAVAGFQSDFTSKGMYTLMQGFMFADWRAKTNLLPSAVSATLYTVPSGGAGFLVNSIAFGEGFAVATNNGIHVVTASAGTTVTAPGLATEASPPTGAKITRVGHQGASADLTLTVTGGIPTLGSTALNFTTLGLIPGEWLFIGGDSAALAYATAANKGFYRIKTIAANAIVFDRWPVGVTTDTGTGKTIQLFFGHVIKNESDPALQKLRTYQAERTLNATNIQYVKGCAADKLSIDVKTGDKITVDIGMVGLDEEDLGAAKGGTRPAVPAQVAFNSSSDFTRLRLINDSLGSDLAVYLTDLKLEVNNGIVAAKAIGTLGGFDLNAADFAVTGSVEAYFASIVAVQQVKANADVALDFALVASVGGFALGWLFDIPLIGLGDGRVKVEKDKPVKLPLSMDAAAHPTLNHTLLVCNFPYLPAGAL
jgi:hypothetical protein